MTTPPIDPKVLESHARTIKHSLKAADELDRFQDEDISDELKTRLRTIQRSTRLLATLLATVEDPENAYKTTWDNVAPDFVNRYSN